jgi:hypothetical protein
VQAAAYGQTDFRAAAGRARVCGRLYGGEGLRPAAADADEGGVRASDASARAQVDFGQCIGIIGGVRTVMHMFPSTNSIRYISCTGGSFLLCM